MIGETKETWLWYCDICDKTFNIESKSKHFFLKHIYTKKNMVLLLKIKTIKNQNLMKWIIYSMILVKLIEIIIVIHLNIDK